MLWRVYKTFAPETRAHESPPGGGEWGEFRQNSDLFEKVGWGVTPRRDSPPLRGGVEGTFGTPRGESLFRILPDSPPPGGEYGGE